MILRIGKFLKNFFFENDGKAMSNDVVDDVGRRGDTETPVDGPRSSHQSRLTRE